MKVRKVTVSLSYAEITKHSLERLITLFFTVNSRRLRVCSDKLGPSATKEIVYFAMCCFLNKGRGCKTLASVHIRILVGKLSFVDVTTSSDVSLDVQVLIM